ncbi:MAG: response regulator [Betaproteobacteria bacterium]|nr:response regulator [Betaproteobacteria bacterium]
MNPQKKIRNNEVHILIAEDSATQAEQLKYLLEQHHYAVTTAANGRLALEAARQRKPTLIITDIVMPEMDGYMLCKAVKSDDNLKDVPVVMVTSLSGMQDIAKSLECGADNFIRKPYEPKILLARIDYILLNRELRRTRQLEVGMEVYLAGKKHFITSEREQIVDLLISTYDEAIHMNEELARRTAQLEATNKELESFSYSVSHDLRAPLRAIDGFSRMLEEDYQARLDEEGRRQIRVIRDNAHKMGQLIDDLLAFSRMGRKAMAVSPVDMAALAAEVFSELRQAGDHRSVRFDLRPMPACDGDPVLLRQVWANLLSNALKFSGRRETPLIEAGGQSEGRENVYYVTDNGAGFDMQYYDKLFGVFQRLHGGEEFPGTGVGLAIVQRAVARHGGRVWAEGKVDQGATFRFALPREAEDHDGDL